MGRREEVYVLNVGANISRQGLGVSGTEGKGGGPGQWKFWHVLGSAPKQLRGSAHLTAASVSPSRQELPLLESFVRLAAFGRAMLSLPMGPVSGACLRVYWGRYSNRVCSCFIQKRKKNLSIVTTHFCRAF